MTSRIRHGYWLTVLGGCTLAVMMALGAGTAAAQRIGGDQGSTSSDSSYVLDKSTYEQITQIQKLMGDEKYSAAIEQAKGILPSVKNESKYAEALINQLIAQNYMLLKNYDAAESYLQRIVALNALQPRAQRSVVYQLATIYLTQGKYGKSIQLYKQVINQTKADNKGVRPSLYYYLGVAYSYAEEYPNAYQYISKAIQLRENAKPTTNEKGEEVKPEPVPKGWYQNLFIVVYKQHNYEKANGIAKMLVAKFPDEKDFWSYYANTYLLLKKDQQATNVYALMHKRGLLESKDEYKQLVSLLIQQHAPFKAASLLSEAMEKGIVPKTVENYNLLATAWMQAKEWDEALVALGKQAEMAPSGEVYLRQASIYLSRLQYSQAVAAARNAIEKGGLDDPGLAWMILGQAAFRADRVQTAINAFHKAENYRSHRKSAQGWIKFVHQATRG